MKEPSVSYYKNSINTIMYRNKILDRNYTYELQTPQAFDTEKLIDAHNNTHRTNSTDDTILIKEYFNIDPKLIIGGDNLIKVTYPIDFEILKVIKRKL